MNAVLFANCRIFDGSSGELPEAMHVLVEGERIKEISDRPITAASALTIDAAGRTLMPGLIDAHYHAIAVDPDIRKIDGMSKFHIAQISRRFLESSLRRGFTSIRDAGGADFGLALACETRLIEGPRLFFSGQALSQTGGHADFRAPTAEHPAWCLCGQGGNALGRIADGVTEVRRAAREELRKGATQIKIMASGGVASPSDPIWNLQYSEEEIRAAVWEARSWRTYVMAHAYTPEAIRRCVEYGVRSIEHGNLIDAEAAAVCAAHDAYVVPTLVTYEALEQDGPGLGFPAASLAKLREVREVGLGSLELLKAAGVSIGFGTDLLGEMHRHQSRELAIRAEVLTPLEVLRSATVTNAALLNRSDELGCVAPGALADLLLVDGNPLDDLSLLQDEGRHLVVIMKNGEIYKHAA